MDNKDLINPLLELEYLIREGVVFSNEEWRDMEGTCRAIIEHSECSLTIKQ